MAVDSIIKLIKCLTHMEVRLVEMSASIESNNSISKCDAIKLALRKAYSDLTEILPIDYLVPCLYSANLLPDHHKKSLDDLSEYSKKVQHFLDHVLAPSVRVGYTGLFEKMLDLMESSDDKAAKFLVSKIRHTLAATDSSFSLPVTPPTDSG